MRFFPSGDFARRRVELLPGSFRFETDSTLPKSALQTPRKWSFRDALRLDLRPGLLFAALHSHLEIWPRGAARNALQRRKNQLIQPTSGSETVAEPKQRKIGVLITPSLVELLRVDARRKVRRESSRVDRHERAARRSIPVDLLPASRSAALRRLDVDVAGLPQFVVRRVRPARAFRRGRHKISLIVKPPGFDAPTASGGILFA